MRRHDMAYAYLIWSLGDISLKHESLLDLVQDGLGLVEGGRVDTNLRFSFCHPHLS